MRNYPRFLGAIPRQKVRSYVLLSRLPLSCIAREIPKLQNPK